MCFPFLQEMCPATSLKVDQYHFFKNIPIQLLWKKLRLWKTYSGIIKSVTKFFIFPNKSLILSGRQTTKNTESFFKTREVSAMDCISKGLWFEYHHSCNSQVTFGILLCCSKFRWHHRKQSSHRINVSCKNFFSKQM